MTRKERAKRINYRVRKIAKDYDKKRICVFRSNSNIYVQLIDDIQSKTLFSYSTKSKDFSIKDEVKPYNIKGALQVGQYFGKKIKEMKITNLCFDRNGFKFHGRVKALADGIREFVKF